MLHSVCAQRSVYLGLLILLISVCSGCVSTETASNEQVQLKPGEVSSPGYILPPSSYMSEVARDKLIERLKPLPWPPSDNSPEAILEYRKAMDEVFYAPRLEITESQYSVDIEEGMIADVPIKIMERRTSKEDIPSDRVLILLHGGGFRVGAGRGELIEGIPVAAESGYRVISIDYRQSPEYGHPAASEDVAAVYTELLKTYAPEKIGIYGTSAGGVLTAMSVTWFQDHGLPAPGAIGIFCAGADGLFAGDARYFTPGMSGYPAPPPSPNPPPTGMGYLDGNDLTAPLISPVFHQDRLKAFPPTLIISGTRDGALSAALYSHSELTRAGVEADLHVWEGMWHGFLYETDMPEAQQAFDVIVNFFREHIN